MEMNSKNMSFCNFVSMEEKMTYTPDPTDATRTVMRQVIGWSGIQWLRWW